MAAAAMSVFDSDFVSISTGLSFIRPSRLRRDRTTSQKAGMIAATI
jgi:hypothetical protein